MKTICVIPARYASTRLPGKPLADIAGKPMIQRVYEGATTSRKVSEIVVATDEERVYQAVEKFGGKALMTKATHPTGTDRLAEVANLYDCDLIINVQGDEPLIRGEEIDALISYFEREPQAHMATLAVDLAEDEFHNPAAVRVVCDLQGNALYFSRSLLPYPRVAGVNPLKHVGIYAYTKEFLLKFANMPQTPLEKAELLEQLRVLENGYKINVIYTDHKFMGIDTPEDLANINEIFKQKGE